ncbi:hypothetical protein TNCV_2343221 [Trichonephila clavipes]|nr:hypothetical protein TNCV_2343221 [Trichonephila clavipes]
MLYELQNGNNTMKAKKTTSCVTFSGEDAVTAQACRRRFIKFCSRDFSLKYVPISGMLSGVNDEVLSSMNITNSTSTYADGAFWFGIHHTALNHFKKA